MNRLPEYQTNVAERNEHTNLEDHHEDLKHAYEYLQGALRTFEYLLIESDDQQESVVDHQHLKLEINLVGHCFADLRINFGQSHRVPLNHHGHNWRKLEVELLGQLHIWPFNYQ